MTKSFANVDLIFLVDGFGKHTVVGTERGPFPAFSF